MTKYFIYCRKSTEEEERQILSIEAQLAELRDFAKQNNLFVAKEYTESKTAKGRGDQFSMKCLVKLKKATLREPNPLFDLRDEIKNEKKSKLPTFKYFTIIKEGWVPNILV